MSDTTQTNAMAEIALALAMGFFSIMVLTMVSMGSGLVTQQVKTLQDDPIIIEKTSEETPEEQPSGQAQNVSPKELVIFHKGRFFDSALTPITAQEINQREKIILGVAPDLSMSKALQARHQISSKNITVVMLNESWLRALKEAAL